MPGSTTLESGGLYEAGSLIVETGLNSVCSKNITSNPYPSLLTMVNESVVYLPLITLLTVPALTASLRFLFSAEYVTTICHSHCSTSGLDSQSE